MTGLHVYPLNIRSPRDLDAVMERIGADRRAGVYFQPKRITRHIFAGQVDFRAAAFVKQELLARGGDAVVSRHVIDATAETSGLLMIGTDGQLNSLLKKMEAMNCWGLADLREGLRNALGGGQAQIWNFPLHGGRVLSLGGGTKIMGILNLTDNSFHAASRVKTLDDMLRRAETMLAEGADILDLGAESTRPGAAPVSGEDELARLIPAVKSLRKSFPGAVISADTYRGRTALAAVEAGADVINDVGGFALDAEMLKHAALCDSPYVLSHIKGTPENMQDSPAYENLIGEMHSYFQTKIKEAEESGLSRERIIIDPGLGFGKRAEDNLLILKELESLKVFGRPVLLGHSRKKFTETAGGVGAGSEERLAATTAVSAIAEGRAEIVRVHDVKENKAALSIARAIKEVF